MSQLKTDLQQVRDLLADPKRWTQGSYARDADGNPLSYRHPDAVCLCLDGAVIEIAGDTEGARYTEMQAHLEAQNDGNNYANFNDAEDTTHADVLAFLDKAIAAL